MEQDFAAGASAARNKLASFLRKNGIKVQTSTYGYPPTDEDFFRSIQAVIQEGGQRPDSGLAMIIFHWWQSTYNIPIAASVIDYLNENGERRHDLFSATSTGGSNTFYLAVDRDGNVVVHRKKHWRNEIELFDTTILRLD